jgi:hypothetical protein
MRGTWVVTEKPSQAEAVLHLLAADGTLVEIDETFDRIESGTFELADPADVHELIHLAREHFNL